jgi:hypothetical protein
LRYSATADAHYLCDVNQTGAAGTAETRLLKVISGIATDFVVDTTYSAVSPGDYIRGQAQGSLISCIDVTTGVLFLTAFDTSITSGFPGWSLNPIQGTPIAANWSGGRFGPVLLSVSPSAGQLGQQNLSVVITGQFTSFVQGTTTASLGAGITVNSVIVSDATHATVSISIASNAAVGSRTVTLTTGAEVDSLANGFSVTAGTPVLVSVSPSSGQQGQQNLSVAITGQFTSFVQGTTTATFGAGITVNSVTVSDATHAMVSISIAASGAVGSRTVILTTGAEVDSLANGFSISAATPQCVTSSGTWQSFALSPVWTGKFQAQFDAMPAGRRVNAVTAFGAVKASTYSDVAAVARFARSGNIDALNGSVYTAAQLVPYIPGLIYHFRLVIDVQNHIYDAYVTPPGMAEIVIGQGLAFNPNQAAITSFGWWSVFADSGSATTCNLQTSSN